MATCADRIEDITRSDLSSPTTDTFLMEIFMQDARAKARARVRGLPANPSPSSLREFVKAYDDALDQRIDRCTKLACGLLSEAEVCLQRPRTRPTESSAAQRGSSLLERGLYAEQALKLSWDRCEEWRDELKMPHARGGSPMESTGSLPRLRRRSGHGSENCDHAEPGPDDELEVKREVRLRSGSAVGGVSSSDDGTSDWQNIAGMEVKWQCNVQ
ncbi:hypothetical protein LTR29_014680 [Friedmanniomyces endolithicus]|nr:hypothetical protein LTR29_014680 [Friedmanniomyces endolithicus]